MTIRKIVSKHTSANVDTYVGKRGEIFFDPADGDLRYADGVSAGGIAIVSQNTGSITGDDTTTNITDGIVSVTNLPNEIIGPVQGIVFEVDPEHSSDSIGALCWNPDDDTLNIFHTGGVVQQVGQETFVRVKNATAELIPNGTVVRCTCI